jgi:DNA-binding CsgD family transcriptional regulator
MKDSEYLQLIEKIYDAIDTPACWVDFLEQFSDVFHSEGAILYLQEESSCHALFEYGTPAFLQQIRSDSHNMAPALYFNLKSQGCFHGLGGVIFQKDDPGVRLFTMRSSQQGPFTNSDVENYWRLMPHLQRACLLFIKQAEAQMLRDCSLNSLNALPMGVILLNRNGKALFGNRAAEKIIERNDGFSLDAEGYCCNSVSTETKALQKLIVDCIETGVANDQGGGASMKLTRSGSSRPLWAQILPLPGQYISLYETPRAVLFISEPDSNTRLSSTVLTSLYGLSLGEAQLATSLAMGRTLESVAREHHRSIHTVRMQLKQSFRKTDTHSQADLVRLILSGPAVYGMA